MKKTVKKKLKKFEPIGTVVQIGDILTEYMSREGSVRVTRIEEKTGGVVIINDGLTGQHNLDAGIRRIYRRKKGAK